MLRSGPSLLSAFGDEAWHEMYQWHTCCSGIDRSRIQIGGQGGLGPDTMQASPVSHVMLYDHTAPNGDEHLWSSGYDVSLTR